MRCANLGPGSWDLGSWGDVVGHAGCCVVVKGSGKYWRELGSQTRPGWAGMSGDSVTRVCYTQLYRVHCEFGGATTPEWVRALLRDSIFPLHLGTLFLHSSALVARWKPSAPKSSDKNFQVCVCVCLHIFGPGSHVAQAVLYSQG